MFESETEQGLYSDAAGGERKDGNTGENAEINIVDAPTVLCGDGSLKYNSRMYGYADISLKLPERAYLTVDSGSFDFNHNSGVLSLQENGIITSVTVSVSRVGMENRTVTYDVEQRTGSSALPFAICSAEGLKAINYKNSSNNHPNYNKNYVLMADIDLNNEGFEPIGKNLAYPFKGTFDDGNKSIKNMLIYKPGLAYYAALFGYIDNIGNTAVKNLHGEGSITTGNGSLYTGGITGHIAPDNGAINSAYSVMSINTGTGIWAGGIARYANGAKINNSATFGSSMDTSSSAAVGRISGSNALNITNNHSNIYMDINRLADNNLNGRDRSDVTPYDFLSPYW